MNSPRPRTVRLSTQGLRAHWGRRPVLHGVTLEVEGGWTAIVGPNGAGKSTLLRCLAGLTPEAWPQVQWDGRPLSDWSATERARWGAWMPQTPPTGGELTVRQTAALGRLPWVGLWGAWTPSDEAAVEQALAQTDAQSWADRPLRALSGGERQRAHLARALATQAQALFLDEPTAHLDPPHQWQLARRLRQWSAQHVVMSVVHDLNLALWADRVVVVDDGRVVHHGAPDSPALHAALQQVFQGELRLGTDPSTGRPVALPPQE